MDNKTEKVIYLRLSEDEYDTIKNNALMADTNITNYVRQIAIHGKVQNNDFSNILEHSNKIGEISRSIKELIYSYAELKLPYQEQLRKIDEKLVEVVTIQKKILKSVKKGGDKR